VQNIKLRRETCQIFQTHGKLQGYWYNLGGIVFCSRSGSQLKSDFLDTENHKMRVIGITGTLGAGKGTVVDILVKEFGFKHYSVREYLLEIIRERGLPENRDSMTEVANELRAKNNSPSYIIEQLLHKAMETKQDSIIESIRTLGEVEALRKIGSFTLLAVDADPKIRYDRVFHHRKSETDQIPFEKFIADEQREMTNADPNKQNLSGCIALADIKLDNGGQLETLHEQVRKLMNEQN
jgi:dephospho-CoA kinase